MERALVCAHLQTPGSHAHVCYLTCDLYCNQSVTLFECAVDWPTVWWVVMDDFHYNHALPPNCNIA